MCARSDHVWGWTQHLLVLEKHPHFAGGGGSGVCVGGGTRTGHSHPRSTRRSAGRRIECGAKGQQLTSPPQAEHRTPLKTLLCRTFQHFHRAREVVACAQGLTTSGGGCDTPHGHPRPKRRLGVRSSGLSLKGGGRRRRLASKARLENDSIPERCGIRE